MEIKSYNKNTYSEWVIRNALYWMTSRTQWKLEQDDTFWNLHLECSEDEIIFELERLLNDYKLREMISLQTENIRNRIAIRVLESIESRLSQ